MPPNHTQLMMDHCDVSHRPMDHKDISPPPSPRVCGHSFEAESWSKSVDSLETMKDAGYDSLSSHSSTSSDEEYQTDIFSSNVSDKSFNVSIAKETVCAMGIPEHLVQQVIENRRLDCGGEFASTEELYLAADEIAQSPEKQAQLARKLYLAEELLKKEKRAKEVVPPKDDHCCVSPESARLSAEMPRVAAPAKVMDKCQLKDRVRLLARENQKLKDRKVCRACKKVELATSGITFLPCGHFITCEKCSEMFDDCLACGKNIMGTVRTFLS